MKQNTTIISNDAKIKLQFITEQFNLTFCKVPSYSSDLLIWAAAVAESPSQVLEVRYKQFWYNQFIFNKLERKIEIVRWWEHFDNKNILALKTFFRGESLHGTTVFLTNLLNWWECVNCKSQFNGKFYRNQYRDCICCMNDNNIIFFKLFINWVVKWHTDSASDSEFSQNKLSKETYFL